MRRNDEIARRFEEFADRLEADGVAYKPSAYRRAAENIRECADPIEDLAAEGQDAVESINRVGDAIASKVIEYIETGSIDELDELRDRLPVEIDALTRVDGVGPKTVGSLYDELGITTLDELAAAAEAEEIRDVSGFGAKTETNIRENVAFARQAGERERIGDVRPLADEVLTFLRRREIVETSEVAGSIRRWRDTIGDIDVLAASTESNQVVDAFTDWSAATNVIEAGENKASLRAEGVRIDLRVVDPDEFGAALQYFTGSKDHNVALRNRAIERDLKMNEYGVFDVSDVNTNNNADNDADIDERNTQRIGDRIAGKTEESMYEALELPWIPPELRENRGEIEAAAEGTLSELLTVEDMCGDLHTHTTRSDGRASREQMVDAAVGRGYEYYAVTDHASGPGMVGGIGLSDDDLREQREAIKTASETRGDEIELLAGVETNIDAEGDLSTGDDILTELDVVVASPHTALGQERETATERLIRAVNHQSVDVLGHPTGRRINERPGLDIDIERVAKAAAEAETALEVNANPTRLDLHGTFIQVARDAGATIAINTDAHAPESLAYARYGVHTARRGWCTPPDVLNSFDLTDLREFLH
ncbi:DNA polymerase/3'-5' exonuclease PolX [Haloquadratum walsbyi]|uniref:DNA polymerase beta n=1 Tax=Haloquadratum walsbyi (strain DSM 16854 / JCM 12705 / C23) TaxID=768065 RepID=G0LGI9_HALWC|nr:DNA polymerase/3'-5' exonuclease PolX [Haloquadratum walsbyi]CCC39209.1 DNA-directed DNA polymerase X [Haloquadratum walsbyi C23]